MIEMSGLAMSASGTAASDEADMPEQQTDAGRRTKIDSKQAKKIVEACFNICEDSTKVGSKKWSCKYCKEFENRSFPRSSFQRPLHHLMGVSETGAAASATPCKSQDLPLSVRNELRKLYKLPLIASPAVGRSADKTAQNSGKQQSLLQAFGLTKAAELQREMADVWYSENLPFELADRPKIKEWLQQLAASGLQNFQPLSAYQLRDQKRISESEANVVAAEDAQLHGAWGCFSTDGGKIDGRASRNLMFETDDAKTVWVGQWSVGEDGKKGKEIGTQLAERAVAFRSSRAVAMVCGATADNLAAEQLGLAVAKEKYENETGELFVILPCLMHIGNLTQIDKFGKWQVLEEKKKEVAHGFETWRSALEAVENVSIFTRNNFKLKLRIIDIQTQLPRFKPPEGKKPVLPVRAQATRMRSVYRLAARSCRLESALAYLYCHQSGLYAEKVVDPDQRAKCKVFRNYWLQEQLSVHLPEARLGLQASHLFIRFADENPVGGVCRAVEEWEKMEKAGIEAAKNAKALPNAERQRMLKSLESIHAERKAMWVTHYHLAGSLIRPGFLFATQQLQDVAPDRVEALEKFLNEYYSLPKMREPVQQVPDPVGVALREWKALLLKTGEYSLLDATSKPRQFWQHAQKCTTGLQELEWYQLRFMDKTSHRSSLFFPIRYLYALRVSQSASERDFSVAGLVSDGRHSLNEVKHASLSHIYWYNHCTERRGRKRAIEEDESSVRDESDADHASAQTSTACLVEEALGEMALDEEKISRHQALAELALPGLSKWHECIQVEEESPLMNKSVALPVLDALKNVVVTRSTLCKSAKLCHCVKAYVQHEDPDVQIAAALLRSGWAQIYKTADCAHATAADVLSKRG